MSKATGQAQRGVQVLFGRNGVKPPKALTFKEKVLRWYDKSRVRLERNLDALEKAKANFKKELQDPKSRHYLISGYVTSALTPVLLASSLLFPVAAPALWPMAGLTGLWSGVILWESFQILRGPFKSKKDDKAPVK